MTVHALFTTAMTLALLMVTCGSSVAQTRCESRGQVYAQKVIVTHKGKKGLDSITLFLVCRPNGNVGIVDHEGKSYQDLDDFRANNEILSEDDEITLPRDFPSVDTSRELELMTVSGKTHGSAPWLWWLTGGIALALVTGGGGALWLRARRRAVQDSDSSDSDASDVSDASDITVTPSAASE
ncbi:hypothetical protein [Streptomyces sp. SD31]|uniref:hypothetical protein n=1 Tax=Streptomyces sp. SD31 TaxID=3452208 RepID=UPI003F893DB5